MFTAFIFQPYLFKYNTWLKFFNNLESKQTKEENNIGANLSDKVGTKHHMQLFKVLHKNVFYYECKLNYLQWMPRNYVHQTIRISLKEVMHCNRSTHFYKTLLSISQ